jgi:hypothetical protein
MLPVPLALGGRHRDLDLIRSGIVVGPAAAHDSPRPKSARELAASAISLGVGNYRVLIGATAAVLVPTFVVGGAALAYWRARSGTSLNPVGSARAAEFVGVAVIVLGNLLAQAAGIHAATNLAAGRVADGRQSLRVALARAGPVAAVGVAVGVLSGLGLVLFIVPGVYLWFTWLVAMPAVVLERRTARDALSRSSYLVKGRWWPVFGGYLLVELFFILWAVVATAIAGAVFHVSSTSQAVAEQLASAFVELALAPVIIAFVALTYLDLRLRKEGFSPTGVGRGSDLVPAGSEETPAGVRWSTSSAEGPPQRQDSASAPVQPSAGPWRSPETPREVSPAGERPERPPGWPAVSPKPPAPGQSVPSRQGDLAPQTSDERPDGGTDETEESR